jgi:hypothetical protein
MAEISPPLLCEDYGEPISVLKFSMVEILQPICTRLQKILNKLIKAMPTFLGWLKKENPLFKNDEKVKKIQQTALLVKALAEIIQVPILNKDGGLNSSAVAI